MARLLNQLGELRADYDLLADRYNALAGTLRSIANFSTTGTAEQLVAKAKNALAFAGDPEIDR